MLKYNQAIAVLQSTHIICALPIRMTAGRSTGRSYRNAAIPHWARAPKGAGAQSLLQSPWPK